jgi:sugar lactone lactonase YvrE
MRSLEVEIAVDAHAQLGEGPLWDDRTGELVWLDTPAGAIHRYRPDTGIDEVSQVPPPISTIVMRASGGLMATHGRRLGTIATAGVAIEDFDDHCGFSYILNDGGVDPAGRFWTGTAKRRKLPPPAHDMADDVPDVGGFLRVGTDHRFEVIIDDVTTTNGVDWSDDGKTMYVVLDGTVAVYDYDVEVGEISNRRPFGLPADAGEADGITLDREGFLWSAFYESGEARRYAPDGTLDTVVKIPVEKCTSVCFGGADLDLLFITSGSWGLPAERAHEFPHAGALFVAHPEVGGRVTNRYAG